MLCILKYQDIHSVWKLEAGNWKLEAGNWKLEAGNWKWEIGDWKVEVEVEMGMGRALWD